MATKATTSQAHTPAPWEIVDQSDDDDVRLELVGDSGSKPIAQIYHSFFSPLREDTTEEEQEADDQEYAANACLITAAPELLSQLRSLREELRGAKKLMLSGNHIDSWMMTADGWDCLLRSTSAVIAKAEGRTR